MIRFRPNIAKPWFESRLEAAARSIRTDYDDNQERDDNGRWTSNGGGASSGNVATVNHDRVQMAAKNIFGRELTPQYVRDVTALTAAKIPGATSINYAVKPHGSDGISISAKVYDSNGRQLVETKRQFESNYETGRKEFTVHHDLMHVDASIQGQGVGTRIFDAQLRAYAKQSGIERVTTAAAWGGQYVWPSKGFTLQDTKQLAEFKAEFQAHNEKNGRSPHARG